MYREEEKKEKELMNDKAKEVLKKRKVDRTWANWLSVFLIYASVIVREHPKRGMALFQYLVIVYKAFSCFSENLGSSMMNLGCGPL